MSLMDLVSWRDLYGYVTAEKAEEIREIQRGAGARDLRRDEAEAALFGSAAPAAATAGRAERIDDPVLAGVAQRKADAALFSRVYSQEEIDRGVALNAAVTLRDPSRARQSTKDVKGALARAGMNMKVVDWQQASGLVGQFVSLARIILYTAVFIIFAVALVIINNAMVMATLQRVKEIGTVRAIGAQKRFVLAMLLLETGVVGLAFGAAGAALGAAWLVADPGARGHPGHERSALLLLLGPEPRPRARRGQHGGRARHRGRGEPPLRRLPGPHRHPGHAPRGDAVGDD